MPFDTLTTKAIKLELVQKILSGRVQRIVQPSIHSVALEIYAGSRQNLVISADPQGPFMALTDEKPRRGTTAPSPLEQLLRKYVRGARLTDIEQPHLERILKLHFAGPEGQVALVCEMMGRLANIIMVNTDGLVIDSIHRVPQSVNRVRTILPRKPYAPPPPQDKQDPLVLEQNMLKTLLETSDRELVWQKLVSTVAGLSPLAAREITFRASGSLETHEITAELCDRLVAVIADLWLEAESVGTASVASSTQYAPYMLNHLGSCEKTESISEAIIRTENARGRSDPYLQARARIRTILKDQRGRLEGKLESLQRSLVPKEEIEQLQHHGNAILGMAWQIKAGQSELVVDAALFGGKEGEEWHIRLDPQLSASENAQKLFARYRKRRDAAQQVPELIEDTENELAYLAQLRTDLDLAQDRNQIDLVEQALADGGYIKPNKKRARPKSSEPLRTIAPDGTPIVIGRNSKENNLVTFRIAGPTDIWLHAHGVPGSHVIIRSGGSLSDDSLIYAAELAAFYSSARDANHVQVDFCERRHVKHMKGGKPGMVVYTHEQTIIAEPHDHLSNQD